MSGSRRAPATCQHRKPDLHQGLRRTASSLISTGTSPFASSLLGVSANGTDAYFFTRDTLTPRIENGAAGEDL